MSGLISQDIFDYHDWLVGVPSVVLNEIQDANHHHRERRDFGMLRHQGYALVGQEIEVGLMSVYVRPTLLSFAHWLRQREGGRESHKR
jgi:hypothetical protein